MKARVRKGKQKPSAKQKTPKRSASKPTKRSVSKSAIKRTVVPASKLATSKSGPKKAKVSKSNPVRNVGLALGIQIDQDGTPSAELDGLTRLLVDELRSTDASSVDLIESRNVPDGSKAVGLAMIGGLVIKVLGSKALGNVIEALKAWLARGQRSVNVTVNGQTLELTSATLEQQNAAIEVWKKSVLAAPAR